MKVKHEEEISEDFFDTNFIKGSDHSEFLIFVIIKCVFLTDLRSKNHDMLHIFCQTTIPESINVKVTMKKFDEEEREDFCEEEYFNFEQLK